MWGKPPFRRELARADMDGQRGHTDPVTGGWQEAAASTSRMDGKLNDAQDAGALPAAKRSSFDA